MLLKIALTFFFFKCKCNGCTTFCKQNVPEEGHKIYGGATDRWHVRSTMWKTVTKSLIAIEFA